MKRPLTKYYPILLGSMTLIIAPLILIIGCFKEGFASAIKGFPVAILFICFGVVYSLPVLGVVYVTFWWVDRYLSSKLLVMVIVDAISIIAVYITFGLIGGSMAVDLRQIYSSAIIVASVIYVIKMNFFRRISR